MRCGGKSEHNDRIMDLIILKYVEIYVPLEEALRKFTSAEIFYGENKNNCSRCKSYEKAKKKLTIVDDPDVPTILLKRFQVNAMELDSVLTKGAYMLLYERCSLRAQILDYTRSLGIMEAKDEGKGVTLSMFKDK